MKSINTLGTAADLELNSLQQSRGCPLLLISADWDLQEIGPATGRAAVLSDVPNPGAAIKAERQNSMHTFQISGETRQARSLAALYSVYVTDKFLQDRI